MSGRLDHRHALVTGAGSGIGAAVATLLHRHGARVSLAGRRAAPLQRIKDQLGDGTLVLDGFDVTDPDAVQAGFERARAAFGPVVILVNNAGEAPSAPFEKTDQALWSRILAVDLTGVFTVTQAAIKDLKEAGAAARVINIASTAGLKGYAYVSAYCAAKHGVIGLTRALALEYAQTQMTVNAVCPGFTDTPLTDQALDRITAKTGRSRADSKALLTQNNPQGRLVTADEVAETVLWLASEAASSITGQAIAVCGGEFMAG